MVPLVQVPMQKYWRSTFGAAPVASVVWWLLNSRQAPRLFHEIRILADTGGHRRSTIAWSNNSTWQPSSFFVYLSNWRSYINQRYFPVLQKDQLLYLWHQLLIFNDPRWFGKTWGAYILKARILTPTIPQKNLNFPQICPKMPQNGPKMAKNDPKWPKAAQMWPNMAPNGPKCP